MREQSDALVRRRQRWMDAHEGEAIELQACSSRIAQIDAEEASLKRRAADLDDEIAQARKHERFLDFVREQVPKLPDRLYSPLSPSDADELRQIATTLWSRITVTDKRTTHVDWH